MKFKYIHKQKTDTFGHICQEGDIIEENRDHILKELKKSPFFKPIPDEIKKNKPTHKPVKEEL